MDQKPKLLAFDLDGTLTESKQPLTKDMGALLAQLFYAMPVAVMSGASWEQFQTQFIANLPKDATYKNLYLFPTNAASCYIFLDGTWRLQYDHSFTQEEKEAVFMAIQKGLVATDLVEPPAQVWGERIQDRGAQISFSPLGQQAPLVAKKEWRHTHDAARMMLRDYIAQELPDYAVSAGGETTVDITKKGITKAYGLRQLAQLTGIPISAMVYAGDALEEGGNDFVVVETGIKTRLVSGPEETAAFIKTILLS